MRYLPVLAGLSGFLAVALGAFGAHALKGIFSPYQLSVFKTGNLYHFIHTFALLFSFYAYERTRDSAFKYSSYCFTLGLFFFSGSLYTLAITGKGLFGAITPIGGVLFLSGWLFHTLGEYRTRR
ncbi:MAG: DUF423 domain-containing protein [Leptospiraceae bacterium]|nr:DUF423 domain-containing protein [Leptospiraceae bacterium]